MNHIDDIFKNSEHEKQLDIRPELWDRLERQLDNGSQPRRPFWRQWMVAASWTVILTLSALLYLNIDTYQVEDMKILMDPHFSKEEVAGLEKMWHVPQSIFVNPDYHYLFASDLKG